MNNSKITILAGGQVLLDLPGTNYKSKNRKLGFILNRTFYTERFKDKHLFRADNSIGFNYKLINQCNHFDLICVSMDFKELWTSRITILKLGKCRNFNKLELQIFLKLRYFKETMQEAILEVEQFNKEFNLEAERNKMNEALNKFSNNLRRYGDDKQQSLF